MSRFDSVVDIFKQVDLCERRVGFQFKESEMTTDRESAELIKKLLVNDDPYVFDEADREAEDDPDDSDYEGTPVRKKPSEDLFGLRFRNFVGARKCKIWENTIGQDSGRETTSKRCESRSWTWKILDGA